METTNEIKLVQQPVISHQLAIVGKSVTDRLAKLEIEKQVATVETVKALKELRAELNKEFADFESQRKVVKSAVLKPYEDLESLYKIEISEKYTNAINLLKDKIAEVETKVKKDKEESIKTYFTELCVAEKIDFLKFEQLNLDINLSTSEKKYKEQVNDFINKVLDDIALIARTDYYAEIMAEFKLTLNASKSITDILDRKEREKAEADRIQKAEIERRQLACKKLGFVWMDMTNAYEYNADIYFTRKQIEDLTKSEFESKLHEFEAKINTIKAELLASKTTSAPVNTPTTETPNQPAQQQVSTAPAQQHEPAPSLSSPFEEVKEEICEAKFKVTGTMNQLRALGAYMKANGITYENIKS